MFKSNDYSNFYASKCKTCLGTKRVSKQGVWTACFCQYLASVKFQIDNLEVSPPELKYKTWDDFTGYDKTAKSILPPKSVIDAKGKALAYCFGSSDASVVSDRSKNLIIHKRINDGSNVVIIGNKKSGRTLLSVLILKECIYASCIHNMKISFKCINSNILKDAARWDNNKTVNHDFLDEVSDIDFLIIDNVDLIEGGHNNPPDIISLNTMFRTRLLYGKPTIIICSPSFWISVQNKNFAQQVKQQWGDEFFQLCHASNNTIIDLKE